MSNKRRLKPKGISRGISRRKHRPRRSAPHRNLNMVPDDATPEEAHRIEMRERSLRRAERSGRGGWPVRAEQPKRTTTNTDKVQAAHEKRTRRQQRNLAQVAQQAMGNQRALREIAHGDWTKKGLGL